MKGEFRNTRKSLESIRIKNIIIVIVSDSDLCYFEIRNIVLGKCCDFGNTKKSK